MLNVSMSSVFFKSLSSWGNSNDFGILITVRRLSQSVSREKQLTLYIIERYRSRRDPVRQASQCVCVCVCVCVCTRARAHGHAHIEMTEYNDEDV